MVRTYVGVATSGTFAAALPVMEKPVATASTRPTAAAMLEAVARVDARQVVVGPHALLSTESGSVVRGPVYAFLSYEDADRNTRFQWPEDIR